MKNEMREFILAFAEECRKNEKRRVKPAVNWETIALTAESTLNPRPLDPSDFPEPPYVPKPSPPEFPKLKVRYGTPLSQGVQSVAKTLATMNAPKEYAPSAWIIVNDPFEEDAFRAGGWLTRPMSELETHKANGVEEFIPAVPLRDERRTPGSMNFVVQENGKHV
jgi:hypothetical protein